jgi:hypothetical protein
MKETVVPKKTQLKIFRLWKTKKNMAEIGREVGVCRKKVAQLIRIHEHGELFDIKKQKNWLIND